MIAAVVAQLVVDKVVARLGRNVNIMDVHGTIVASGDLARVGTVHEGARRVLREGGPVAVTAREAAELAGTQAGVNALIRIDGEVVGVVGVTGEPDRVWAAAASVVMTVELLLVQEVMQEERQWRSRARAQLVEDLAAGRLDAVGWQRRLQMVGVAMSAPYLLSAVRLDCSPGPSQARRQLDVAAPGLLMTLDVDDVAWVLAGAGHHEDARYRLAAARLALRRAGVGGPMVDAGTTADLHELTDRVQRVRLALRSAGPADAGLNELELPALLAVVDTTVAQAAAGRLLMGLDDELRRTLQAFLDADLVVTRAAVALTVHRNTLLGRLDRIARVTGRDPRRFADAPPCMSGSSCTAVRRHSRHDSDAASGQSSSSPSTKVTAMPVTPWMSVAAVWAR